MSLYSSTVLADTPLRYYRLDDTSGTTVTDSSGNGQNGTITGGVTLSKTGLIANDPDFSMLFDGTSGTINCPTTGLPTGAQPWSLEAWITMNSIPVSGLHTFLEFGTGSTNEAAVLFINGTGNVCCNTYAGNRITGLTTTANTTYHCVATYDGTNLRLYVNGALQGTLACTPNVVLTYCRIGSEDVPADDFFSGTIDECAIYTYALSLAQIQNHHTVGSTWSFTENLTLTETFSRSTSIQVTESLTLTETFQKQSVLSAVESLTPLETVQMSVTLSSIDLLFLSEFSTNQVFLPGPAFVPQLPSVGFAGLGILPLAQPPKLPYMINGTILDTQPLYMSAPVSTMQQILAGAQFSLEFFNPSSATQLLIANGSTVTMRFGLVDGSSATGQVQLQTVQNGPSFQVMCTVVQTIQLYKWVIVTQFS